MAGRGPAGGFDLGALLGPPIIYGSIPGENIYGGEGAAGALGSPRSPGSPGRALDAPAGEAEGARGETANCATPGEAVVTARIAAAHRASPCRSS